MFLEYYKFTDFPFQLTADPRFFFESAGHNKAMAHLLFGLNQGEGFIVITGEIGAGKTTLLGRLLDSLDPSAYVAAKIVSTHLQGDDMLRSVVAAFGLPFMDADKTTLLRRFEDFAIQNHRQEKRTLLLVDEVQNITPQALEELRMLSNFQTGNQVLLQSVLLGQPQFRRMLSSPNLEQFRQRIIASYHLGPLTETETGEYIRHRLGLVGWAGDPAIDQQAIARIFAKTGGVPRKINILCTRILLHCYLEELHVIGSDIAGIVALDLAAELNTVLGDPGERGPAGIMHEGNGESARLDRIDRLVDRHEQALRDLALLAKSYLNIKDDTN